MRLGFSRLQAKVRGRQMQVKYERKRAAGLVLQKHIRGLATRREFKRKRAAIIVLQAHTRGMLARKAVKKRKRDVRGSLSLIIGACYASFLCPIFMCCRRGG